MEIRGNTGYDRDAWKLMVEMAAEALISAWFRGDERYRLLGVNIHSLVGKHIDESTNCWVEGPTGELRLTVRFSEPAPDATHSDTIAHNVDRAGRKNV